MRNVKIVCTIGPASASLPIVQQLLVAGMNVARLNFSHGSHETHGQAVRTIREVAARNDTPVAILQDLQGPRIRVGHISDDGIVLQPDQLVRLVPVERADPVKEPGPSKLVDLPVPFDSLVQDVHPGHRVLIDDGRIQLVVRGRETEALECLVRTGGRVTSRKGINLPDSSITVDPLTEKDREDLRFGLSQGIDYTALSFVQGPSDVRALKRLIGESGSNVPVIAKIERSEAVDNLDAIFEESDGVMIARGDLALEMSAEVVPILQKRIIRQANHRRCLVITATQMLESMTAAPTPTRAEASDVANSVFDGTDAVMLSSETSQGSYPVQAVEVMARLIKEAEKELMPKTARTIGGLPDHEGPRGSIPEAVCAAASQAAGDIGARAIAAFTDSGMTARLLSKQRPSVPTIALTPCELVRRRMSLYWGIMPCLVSPMEHTDDRIREVEKRLKQEALARSGDRIAVVSGTQTDRPEGTNFLKLHEVQ